LCRNTKFLVVSCMVVPGCACSPNMVEIKTGSLHDFNLN
jgi:hypothetical protein